MLQQGCIGKVGFSNRKPLNSFLIGERQNQRYVLERLCGLQFSERIQWRVTGEREPSEKQYGNKGSGSRNGKDVRPIREENEEAGR